LASRQLYHAVKELPPEQADEDSADVFLSFVKPVIHIIPANPSTSI
jgi:hypothetical protein